MPFEVFRRHQRKLLAIFAIMAMFGFVVSDSLPRLLSSGYLAAEIRKSSSCTASRSTRASSTRWPGSAVGPICLSASLDPRMPEYFGGLKQRDMIDALILQHEADRLGIPATPEMGRAWLKQKSGGRMNAEFFTLLYSRFSNEISEEHLLADIANQARLTTVRLLLSAPIVTPYDVYRSYRDQNERIGAKLVEIPVDPFLSQVAEPSAGEIEALYQKYKEVLPDPAKETPGFKIPRQIQLEILSLDGTALARGIGDKLTEAELRPYYENHKSEYEVPSELPKDLFADQPDLTPPIVQSFAEIRGILVPRLAEEKAQAEILDKFERIKEGEIIPFAEKYLSGAGRARRGKKARELRGPAVFPNRRS